MAVGSEQYLLIKAQRANKRVFIRVGDKDALDRFRDKFENKDLFCSTCYFNTPDLSAEQVYPLYFVIASADPEQARTSSLEACYHITDNFSIPQDFIEIVYRSSTINTGEVGRSAGKNDGGTCATIGASHSNHSGNTQSAAQNVRKEPLTGADETASNTGRTGVDSGNTGGGGCKDSGKSAKEGSPAAEIILSVPPLVFGTGSTQLMPAINYHLARQMVKDGIQNINIDVYHRDYLLPMPNSINSATGRFAIALTIKELMYMDAPGIFELSEQPRPEGSFVMLRQVPEAAEWFAEALKEAEKRQRRQNELRKALLQEGWQIQFCISRLQRLCLYDNVRLEAYRAIAQLYAWLGAAGEQLWQEILCCDRRNPIRDYKRLRAIVSFASENPQFVGCDHTLLQRFCPPGGCFMKKLIEEHEKPYLFQEVKDRK